MNFVTAVVAFVVFLGSAVTRCGSSVDLVSKHVVVAVNVVVTAVNQTWELVILILTTSLMFAQLLPGGCLASSSLSSSFVSCSCQQILQHVNTTGGGACMRMYAGSTVATCARDGPTSATPRRARVQDVGK